MLAGVRIWTNGGVSPIASAEKDFLVKVQIGADLCQGHGRCYDLAPALFDDDEEGYGQVLGNGVVPPEREDDARRAALNCPEHAIKLIDGA
jgi:ferredoxin